MILFKPKSATKFHRMVLALSVLATPLLPIFNQNSRAEDMPAWFNTLSKKVPDKAADPKIPQDKQKKTQSTTTTTPKTAAIKPRLLFKAEDKLPKDVEGCGLTGLFEISGEDPRPSGGLQLVAVDRRNTWALRIFTVVNLTSGLPPGDLAPALGRRQVKVPSSRPLIFIRRGFLPGTYDLKAQ